MASRKIKNSNTDGSNEHLNKNTTKQVDVPSQKKKFVEKLNDFLLELPPQNPRINLRYIVNLQKGTTLFYLLALMWYYQNYAYGPYLLCALHGTYGFVWILKDFTFGDPAFNAKITFGSSLMSIVLLLAYWYNGYELISGQGIQYPTPERICFVILLFMMGCILMIGSDIQKNVTLRLKKNLIDEGFMKYNRNPNYLGEMMIYGSFNIASGSYIAWIIDIFVWITLFLIRMASKDESLRRKEKAKAYFKRSYLFLFKIYGSEIISTLVYGAIAGLIYLYYSETDLADILVSILPE